MARWGPGKAHRAGLTAIDPFRMFPDDAAAERWFEAQRWPDGRFCPDCGSTNTVVVKNRKPTPCRRRDCRGHFSVRKGTVMQSSKVGLQKWVIALYVMTTGTEGTSSMKPCRALGIGQGTAWFLMQRIREGFMQGVGRPFPGPVEADETCIGGKRKNMPKARRETLSGRGAVGKGAGAGAEDRVTKRVSAAVVPARDGATLQGFVRARARAGAVVCTDDAAACRGMTGFEHEAARHSVGEYVRGEARTNGVESFRALLKRGCQGTFHHLSEKHLGRYAAEFADHHNVRDFDTKDQMALLARGMNGRRLRYADPIA